MVDQWEDCYNHAIAAVKDYQIDTPATVYVDRLGQSHLRRGYLYATWYVNDGWTSDSQGAVTKYTSKFVKAPTVGNFRYMSENSFSSIDDKDKDKK